MSQAGNASKGHAGGAWMDGAACRSRTRIPGLEDRHTSRCVNAAEWFPEGSNLAPAVLHTAALPDELENLGREAGTRTPSAWPQTRSADPYTTSRCCVDRVRFELTTFSLQGSCSTNWS